MEKPDIITAIIIDDDPFCSFQLQELIGIHARQIKVVATCDSAEEGLRNILELAPALVFLEDVDVRVNRLRLADDTACECRGDLLCLYTLCSDVQFLD